MHNESRADLPVEAEAKKESFFRRNGDSILWTSIFAMSVMNLTASIIDRNNLAKSIRLEQIKLAVETAKQNAS